MFHDKKTFVGNKKIIFIIVWSASAPNNYKYDKKNTTKQFLKKLKKHAKNLKQSERNFPKNPVLGARDPGRKDVFPKGFPRKKTPILKKKRSVNAKRERQIVF